MFLVVGALVFAAHRLASLIIRSLQPNPVAEYLGAISTSDIPFAEKAGASLAKKLPFSLDTWVDHLRWAQRGGEYQGYGIGRLVFLSMILGLGGLLIPILSHAPATWLMPFVAASFPFVWLRSASQKVKIRAEKALPEMAALIAAEVAAGVSPEEALAQATRLPGSLAQLVQEAIQHASQKGLPLLSHETHKGALRQIFEGSGIPALRSFVVQLDVAAGKGIEVAARMSEISRTLSREYRNRLTRNTEKLETNLTVAVAMFYFVPMMALILIPLFVEMIAAI